MQYMRLCFAFFVFWLFTTGEWRQYIPTTKKLIDVAMYYAYGIFQGRPHPVEKTPGAKHNPLQRLTYLALSALMLPVQMLSGMLYYTWNLWGGAFPTPWHRWHCSTPWWHFCCFPFWWCMFI